MVELGGRVSDQGGAVVLGTHDADLRAAIADRIGNVAGGRAFEPAREAALA